MFLTCKCLNVSVKTRVNELKSFENDKENLTELEKSEEFFSEPLATAIELEGINKEQSGLVISRNVGSWVIHRCINCSMYTHAVHRDHGAALVLINKNLVSTIEKIEKLKSHPNFSSIFRIIIDRGILEENENQLLTKYSISQLPNTVRLSLTSLQQQLEQSVQKKASLIEEEIRRFTAEQYQLLEQFREQAHLEHHVLTRIICSQESLKLFNNTETGSSLTERAGKKFISPPNNSEFNIKSSDSGFVSTMDLGRNSTPKKTGNPPGNRSSDKKAKRVRPLGKEENFDAEALFDLEGMDDTLTPEKVEVSGDENDTDGDDSGQDEGIHIPRGQRGGHPTLAKSLPVSVPNFTSFSRRDAHDDDDDQLSMNPLDPNNIRASIKALAKSVHGDAVFGDLPRPRFSTQI